MLRVIGRIWAGLFILICTSIGLSQLIAAQILSPLLAYTIDGDLYARDLGVNVTLQLTFDGQRYVENAPAWSPDGRALAFTRQLGTPYSAEDPDSDVYWMAISSPERTRLTESENNDIVPDWSPDGTSIVYLSTTRTGHHVRLIRLGQLESQAQTLPIQIPQHLHTTFKWMPDGKTLLFHAIEKTKLVPMSYDIPLGLFSILSPQEAYYPAPSPSGEFIAALMPTRGGHTLALLTTDPLPRHLTGSLSPRIGVVWQDDSHLLYLSEDRLSVLRVNVESGYAETAFTFLNHVMSFAFHP